MGDLGTVKRVENDGVQVEVFKGFSLLVQDKQETIIAALELVEQVKDSEGD